MNFFFFSAWKLSHRKRVHHETSPTKRPEEWYINVENKCSNMQTWYYLSKQPIWVYTGVWFDTDMKRIVLREVQCLKQLQHENVILFWLNLCTILAWLHLLPSYLTIFVCMVQVIMLRAVVADHNEDTRLFEYMNTSLQRVRPVKPHTNLSKLKTVHPKSWSKLPNPNASQ